ncbi:MULTISPECIES: CoA ester lyase [unclassified Ruegeria]|uniref:HpcH/HpaI aldolase/citrate lyase family protein n=1 Tax=unclassified Ruegeria TaxID=2625375 RepID=UPI001492DDE7|nr:MULTISPECIES: CoA ester lyase [unclassified Ruegeria]NOD77763.1 CoA ester lyase [Ruegeria sp. HKCCD4332]NOD87993.1 CoA ester lyase [Ruegeria sp. HKCCD4318]NOE14841.1 CoA ester lyase [Ruegeria sp. HKCCD4318-2]NOG11556.1 CoA ester lyase [Ruegeria sp. HKCCD4315]
MKNRSLRSLLYIPGHVEALVPKAARTEADVIILDLEDAVPQSEKENGRQRLRGATTVLRNKGKSVAVRINNDDALLEDDLSAATAAGIDYLILPKVENREFIQKVADFVHAKGCDDVSLIGLIESPVGLLNAPMIAAAQERLIALNLGTEDFCLEMGMEPEWGGLLYPSQQIVTAARAAGKIPLGYAGSIAQYHDIPAFSTTVERSAKLGFEGGFAIHPSQVSPLNTAFTPSKNAVAQAQRIVAAYEKSLAEGRGAVSLDNKMIDLPIVEKARRVLEAGSRFSDRFA